MCLCGRIFEGASLTRGSMTTDSGFQIVGIDRLKSLIRDTSKKLMCVQSKRPDFVLEELQTTPLVYGHWMAMILVSGKDIKITFKVHFKTRSARHMAAQIYAKAADDLTVDQALDFVREYGNLIAGSVKKSLLELNVSTGVSLPVVTRGFDEVFFHTPLPFNTTTDIWILRSDVFDFKCSVIIEAFGRIDMSTLSDVLKDDAAHQGDVEFL